jgi:phage terminase large subunit
MAENTAPLRDIEVTTVYDRTLAAQEKTVVNRGGARSSKSYSIAQLLIEKATNTPRAILVTRKTMPSLKMTAYKLIIDLLKDYGYYKEERDWQTAPLHYCLGSSTFWFCSLDELTKIKSTEFTDIWMEEANEFTWQDYLTLKLRLSGKVPEGDRARIYLSFNPMDAAHWIPTKLCRLPDVLEIGRAHV